MVTMQELTVVLPQIGYYCVSTATAQEQVTKDKRCTCGGTTTQPCTHIRAVALYLQAGGIPAPPAEQCPSAHTLSDSCPICSAPVIPQADHWRCVRSPGHYWRWRGERTGVKAFLTRPHPAKAGAFYELTVAERDAILEQAHQRMVTNGYSPYA